MWRFPIEHLRKWHDKVMQLGFLGCGDDIIHAELTLIVSIADVLCYTAVKQNRLLGDDPNLRAQESNVDPSRLTAINELIDKESQTQSFWWIECKNTIPNLWKVFLPHVHC